MWVCFGGDLAVGLAPVLVMLDLLDVAFGYTAGIVVDFVVVGTEDIDSVVVDTEDIDSVVVDTVVVD